MTVNVSKPAINVREKLAELDKPTGIAGEAMLRAESVAEQAALLGFQPKNIFINGDQRIWQRGTTQTGIGASTEVVVSDRWRNYQSGSTGRCTWSQDTDAPDGHEYSAKIQVTTADTSVDANHRWNIAYRMETDDFQQMGFGTSEATGFTVQFWVKTNKTGTYSFDAYVNNSKPTCKRNFTVSDSGAWTKIVLTFPGSSVATGAEPSFWIWLQAGSDYTDDRGEAWTSSTDGRAHGQTVNLYDSTSNYFMITGIQMVRGEYPTGLPFDRRSYGEELALCQRYYYRIDSAYNNANYQRFAVASIESGTQAEGFFMHPVEMRAIPTLGFSAASDFHVYTANVARAVSGLLLDQSSPTTAGVAITSTGMTAGNVGLLNADNNKDAFIEFKAEL